MKKIARLCALCLVLLVSIATGRNSYSGEVFSVPVSDQIIRGELVLPGGKIVKFGAREGSMVTIRDQEKGYFIGFAATIEDEARGAARFSFFNIEERIEVDEVLQGAKYISSTNIKGPGSVHVLHTSSGNIVLRFRRVVLGEFPGDLLDPESTDPDELERTYGVTSGGSCCVGCGRLTVCGSEVSAECGSCSGGGYRAV